MLQLLQVSFIFLKLLDDNNVYTWGTNEGLSLGINDADTTKTYTTPTLISSGVTINSIACGDTQTFLYSSATEIYGFGTKANLGANNNTQTYTTPKRIPELEGSGFTKVFSNGLTSWFLDGSEIIWGTGNNQNGQLGQTNAASRLNALKQPTLNTTQVKGVYGSTLMTIILDKAGNLWTSGSNLNGELGLNRVDPVIPQTDLIRHSWFTNNSLTVTYVSHAYRSTFVVASDGVLYAYGNNQNGQLGITGGSSWVIVPTVVNMGAAIGLTVAEISVGTTHTLLRTTTGRVFCVGSNQQGQCGTNSYVQSYSSFVEVFGSLVASSILATEKNSFAIVSGNLTSWGEPKKFGASFLFNTPDTIIPASEQIEKVYCGDQVSYAITTTSKQVWGWGKNELRQVDFFDSSDRVFPQLITNLTKTNYSMVSTGGFNTEFHTIVMEGNSLGTIYGWGSNTKGQLGTDNNNPISPTTVTIPIPITTTGPNITGIKVVIGTRHTTLLGSFTPATSPRGIHVFGSNDFGQIGQGVDQNARRLQLTDSVDDIAAGDYHTAWISNKLLNVCGNNRNGQLGLGSSIVQLGIPTENNFTLNSAVSTKVWAGSFSTFIQTTQGLWVTGDNTRGALGLATSKIYYVPERHPFTTFDTEGVLKISGARGEGHHTIVVTLKGNLYVMGDNQFGQLGLGTFTNSFTPQLVAPSGLGAGYKSLDVCAGRDHSLVVFGKRSCPNDCRGSGTDPKGTCDTVLGKCNCFSGFLGEACELFECTDPKCSGYGKCDTTKGICICQTGFEGDVCQFRKCPNSCSGRGTCQRQTGICNCEAGFIGIDCSTNGSGFLSLSVVSILISVLFFF